MARNITKVAKSGRFVRKSYTQANPMAVKTVAENIRSARSNMFARLAKGETVAEVLFAIEGMAEIALDFSAVGTWTNADAGAVRASLRSLYTEIKHIGAGVYLAYGEAKTSPAPTPSPVPNGTYTVVIGGEHRTIRLRKDFRADAPEGSQVAAVLTGPDNGSDYTGFAFVSGGNFKVWGKYRASAAIAKTSDFLAFLMGGRENWEGAGNAYAKASGRCFMCNRQLTNPESLEVMIGPECRKKIAA